MNPLVQSLMGVARHRQSQGFVTTWLIEEGDKTVTLPLRTGYTYDMSVNWGDGSTDTITAWDAAEKTHTYTTAGTKTVSITGTCQAWYFNNGGDKLKFRTVENWGDVGFAGLGLVGAFYGCSNATSFGTEMPYYTVTSLHRTWRDCTSVLSFPEITNLTDLQLVTFAWYDTRASSYPDISTMTWITSIQATYAFCSIAATFSNLSALVNVTSINSLCYACTSCTSVPVLPSASTALTDTLSAFHAIGAGMGGTVVELWNAMEVSGFSDGNAKFHRNGTVNTKNGYRYNDLLIEWDGTSKWEIKDGATILYESTDNVATPDLVTTWAAVSGGATIGTVAVGDYPNITDYANCFTGATGLSNYADIPDAWKGL